MLLPRPNSIQRYCIRSASMDSILPRVGGCINAGNPPLYLNRTEALASRERFEPRQPSAGDSWRQAIGLSELCVVSEGNLFDLVASELFG